MQKFHITKAFNVDHHPRCPRWPGLLLRFVSMLLKVAGSNVTLILQVKVVLVLLLVVVSF